MSGQGQHVATSVLRCAEVETTRVSAVDRALVTGDAAGLTAEGVPGALELLGGDLEGAAERARGAGHALADALDSALGGRCDAVAAAPIVHAHVTGVAALIAFLRANFSGPPLPASFATEVHADLAVDGEDPPHDPALPHLLLVAEAVLLYDAVRAAAAGARYAHWWAARVAMTHHAVLTRPTPTLHRCIFGSFSAFLGGASSARATLLRGAPIATPLNDCAVDDLPGMEEPAPERSSRDGTDDPVERELLVLANVELCMAQRQFYDADGAAKSLDEAAALAEISVRVHGRLGVRTKFQQSPTSQLVSRVYRKSKESPAGQRCHALVYDFPLDVSTCSTSANPDEEREASSSAHLPRNVPLQDSEVLGYVKLIPDAEGSTGDMPVGGEDQELVDLSPVEQAIVLAYASLELARSAGHELTNEQAAPYVSRVLQSAGSKFGTSSALQLQALCLRSRFEQGRGRYMERNMAQMEEISRFIDSPGSDVCNESKDFLIYASSRMSLIHASGLPPQWELKKMLAVALGKMGLVKSAMEIFEELQLWDELVDCHRLIGNLGVAEELVRVQLSRLDELVDTKSCASDAPQNASRDAKVRSLRASRRPRLLCVLGDILRDTTFYEQAWSESHASYGRAKRSLGRIAFERSEWKSAIAHFQGALRLNPLFPEIWYMCGCAAMEVPDMRLAAVSFTNVVRETPDNAEAWNNLGKALHELGRLKQSLNAFLQASNKKRDSWRIWDNVLQVATQLRVSGDIVRAMDHLLDLRGKAGVSGHSIAVAVDEVLQTVLGEPPRPDNSSEEPPRDRAAARHTSKALLKLLARATTLVSSEPGIWDAYARLHSVVPGKESRRKSAECRQRQLRALLSHQDWKTETAPFRNIARASLAYARAAADSEDDSVMYSARLHVESMVQQTQDVFGTDPAFELLLEAQDTLVQD